jgi:predicted RNase H-like HicB family nuclease
MLNLQFSGKIPVVFFKECKSYIACCPPLDLASQGKTLKEAEKNFFEVLSIYIQETVKRGTLIADLRDHG